MKQTIVTFRLSRFYLGYIFTIVIFTQLCGKFPPTALLNFACDWLALDRNISFGRLTSPRVTLYPYRELTITSKVQECCGREIAAKLGEFDYSRVMSVLIIIEGMENYQCPRIVSVI